jgi:hypothetical protein
MRLMTDLTTAQRFFLQAHPGKSLRQVLLDVTTRHETLADAAAEVWISVPTLRIWMVQVGLPTSRDRFEVLV